MDARRLMIAAVLVTLLVWLVTWLAPPARSAPALGLVQLVAVVVGVFAALNRYVWATCLGWLGVGLWGMGTFLWPYQFIPGLAPALVAGAVLLEIQAVWTLVDEWKRRRARHKRRRVLHWAERFGSATPRARALLPAR